MRHVVWFGSMRHRLGWFCVSMVAALLTVVVTSAPADAATVVSETTWGGTSPDDATAVAAAPDGGSYLTGTTTPFDAVGDPIGGENIFLIKTAADGSVVWQQSWHGVSGGIYEGNDVAVAPDGSVYVTGLFAPNGIQAGDVLLLKFSPDGSLIWQRTWDSGNTETGESVTVASDGSIYVTGGSGAVQAVGPLVLLRFAPDGTLVWQRTWTDLVSPAQAQADGQAIAVGPDGNIHVAGVGPRHDGSFDFDMVLLTLDPQGTLLWQRELAAGDNADARGGVTVAGDGSIYVAGGLQAVQSRTAVNDTLLAKFSPTGQLVWDRAYGGADDDFPGGIIVAPNGTLLIGGSTQSPFVGGPSFAYLLNVGANGKGIACTSVDGSGFDEGDDLALAADGTVALGATTTSPLPFAIGSCSQQTRNLKSTLTTPAIPLADGTGVVADPNGTTSIPDAASPGEGGFDAALIRIAV